MMPEGLTRLNLRGRIWHLEFVDRLESGAYGECDDPSRPQKRIRIAMNQSSADMMDTLVHELIHACLPDTSEEATSESARDISNVLRRLKARIEFTQDD
jgi:hypothetical protein